MNVVGPRLLGSIAAVCLPFSSDPRSRSKHTVGAQDSHTWRLLSVLSGDCYRISAVFTFSPDIYTVTLDHSEVHFLQFCPLTQWLTVGCLHQCDSVYQKSLMSFICEFPRRAWFLRQEFTSGGFCLIMERLDSWEINHFKLGRNISQRIFNFGQYWK